MDSVVLCDLCFRTGYRFSIAHCNFGLRGAESDRDEAFVRSLARHYQVPVYVQHFETNTFASSNKLSVQEAARKLRYDWFLSFVASSEDIAEAGRDALHDFVLTAHHQDDTIETVLMNFFKGTGISGLRGIVPKQNKIVRPLLFACRKDLEFYASENDLKWVHDSSNDATKYTRNHFRHNVIPTIEKVFPEVRNNIANNIQRFAEVEELYQQAIDQYKKSLVQQKGTEYHIPVLKLLKCKPLPSIVYELIKNFGFSHRQVTDVIRLTQSDTGKYVTSGSHRVLRNRNWLIISALHQHQESVILMEEGATTVFFDDRKIDIRLRSNENLSIDNNSEIALLDAKHLRFPLLLRTWKPGDYFYPLGMRKKKKLARFFIDQKLSRNQKEKIWVIESNKKIAWVVGLRIDDRFKIVPATTRVLQLRVTAT